VEKQHIKKRVGCLTAIQRLFMNNIKQKAFDIIKERRDYAHYIANLNQQNLEKDKEYAQLKKELALLTLDIAKDQAGIIKLAKVASAKKRAKEVPKLLSARKKELGLESEINYFCKNCSDTGLINNEMCQCLKRELSKLLMQSSNIKDVEIYCFSKIKMPKDVSKIHKDSLQKLYDGLKNYAENFPNSNKTKLTISSGTGTGKTYAVKVLANNLINKGFYVVYTTAFGLNEMLLKHRTTFSPEKDKYIEGFFQSDMLIIDDLGTEPNLNNVTLEYLYQILNERLEQNKHTIITTNLDALVLRDRYEERIHSRLFCKENATYVVIKGEDLRARV